VRRVELIVAHLEALMRSSRFFPLLTVVVLAFAAACGGGGSSSDAEADPVTLRLGTNDPSDQATAAAIEEFARQADELSNGLISIEPVWRAAGDPSPDDWDQAVARMVLSGELDMGLIPTAAWDTEGVTTLRALNTPFLVDSDELVEQVVTTDLADDLLGGLDDVGITGLALLPEGLRHVFAFGEPLVSPSDFAGATIRAPRSDTVYALFEALGATVDDPNGSDFDAAVADGSIAGAESSFARAAGLPGERLTATGNLTLFPKVNALVVNRAVFDALSDDQQAVLRDAAERTVSFGLADTTTDAQLAQEYCETVGGVVLASEADVAAFAEAAQPLVDQLEQDATTQALIDRIRALKDEVAPAPAVAACESNKPVAPPDVAPDGSEQIPEATYTRVVTREASLARGLDPVIVDELLGPDGENVIVLEIADGRWTQYETPDNGQLRVGDLGTYSYDSDGRWVTVSSSGGCRDCVAAFDWTFADGVLSLTLVPIDGEPPYDDGERLITEGDYTQGE
jgi:TRAP-type C4-dicarboxylate transport system substrate-binding protein